MSHIAIRVDQIAKQYSIGMTRHRRDTLRDEVAHGVSVLLGHRPRQPKAEAIWALKDVSFAVDAGEVVGIIGRNGAGKSTLLKILSRVTMPTAGRAQIFGRVGSLLEVGTGFHDELTGRENIYLNGAILGMKKAEIDRRFDDIVGFAEVERFIDTPVKRYSSGMYVRLAFAVAAHLESEILLVDEVLAVGDAAFREKCIGTMQRSASAGRTVLFVSHNMPTVQHLCTRVLLFTSGRISADGPPEEVIKRYLSDCMGDVSRNVSVREWPDRETNGRGRIVDVEVTNERGDPGAHTIVGGNVCFTLSAEFYEPVLDPCFGVVIHDAAGTPVLDLRSIHDGLRTGHLAGSVLVQMRLERLGLYPGDYFLSPWVMDATSEQEWIDWVKLCYKLRVDPAPGPYGDMRLDPRWGKYWVPSTWKVL